MRASGLDRPIAFDQQEDSLIQLGAAASHAESRGKDWLTTHGSLLREKLGIVYPAAWSLDGSRIGEEILAKPHLAAQPPGCRMKQKRRPDQVGQRPQPPVAALDVRPLVS